MAIFRCYTTPKRAIEIIEQYARKESIAIERRGPERLRLRSNHLTLDLVALGSTNDFADVSVRMTANRSWSILFGVILLALLYSLYAAFTEIQVDGIIAHAIQALVFYALPCAFALLYMQLRTNSRAGRTMKGVIETLRTESRVEQLTPSVRASVTKSFDCIVIIVVIVFVLGLFYSLAATFALVLLPVFLISIAETIWMNLSTESWKPGFVERHESARRISCTLVVVWFVVTLAASVIQHARASDRSLANVTSFEPGVVGEWIEPAIDEYRADRASFATNVLASHEFGNFFLNSIAVVQWWRRRESNPRPEVAPPRLLRA